MWLKKTPYKKRFTDKVPKWWERNNNGKEETFLWKEPLPGFGGKGKKVENLKRPCAFQTIVNLRKDFPSLLTISGKKILPQRKTFTGPTRPQKKLEKFLITLLKKALKVRPRITRRKTPTV